MKEFLAPMSSEAVCAMLKWCCCVRVCFFCALRSFLEFSSFQKRSSLWIIASYASLASGSTTNPSKSETIRAETWLVYYHSPRSLLACAEFCEVCDEVDVDGALGEIGGSVLVTGAKIKSTKKSLSKRLSVHAPSSCAYPSDQQVREPVTSMQHLV